MQVKLKVFVMQCAEYASINNAQPGDIKIDTTDYMARATEDYYGKWLVIEEREISIEVEPLPGAQVAEMMIDRLNKELNKLNAQHHVQTEKVKDSMSKWLQLAAPKEGEYIPRREVPQQPETDHRNDIPF